MERINLVKKVFDKDKYNQIIDTKFNQFIIETPTTSSVISNTDIEDFFKIYEKIFYNIPQEGELNSHKYLINKSSEYLGITSNIDIQPLLDEITELRNELLQANTTIANFTTGSI
jgi:hypothetical protein